MTPRPTLRRRLTTAGVLLLPVVELALLIQAGVHLGVGPTLLLLVVAAVAGSLVMRGVGRPRPAGPGGATVVGRPPAESAVLVVAGVLLIVPGFVSDVAGLLLLVPAVRAALVRRAGEAVLRRVRTGSVRIVPGEVFRTEVVDGDVTVRPADDVRITDVRIIEPPRHP